MQETLIGLLIPFTALVFAAIFYAVWKWGNAGRNVLNFTASFMALAAGFLVFHFAADPDGRFAAAVSHLMYGIAMVFMAAGIANRAEVDVSIKFIVAVQLTAAALIALCEPGNITPRLMAMNSAYGICFGVLALALYRTVTTQPADRLIRLVIAILAVQNFVRPVLIMILEDKMSAAAFRDSPAYAATAFLIATLSLLLAVALMYAVASDQLRAVRAAAGSDALTGLLMRGPLEEEARSRIQRTHADGSTLSVILADIDHFKSVNDVYGHQAGDAAIAAFGGLIARTIRDGDLAGRVGGEEFCIVVDDCDEKEAAGLAERLRKTLLELEQPELSHNVRLTASFGVAQLRKGETYRDVFKRSDQALYEAKKFGRNRVETSLPIHAPKDAVEPQRDFG